MTISTISKKNEKFDIKTPKLKEIPFDSILESDSNISEISISYNNVSNLSIPVTLRHDDDFKKKLRKITKLTVMCCLLKSTEGIQYFQHLQDLNLQSNSIHDLSGFSSLKELCSLNLDSNQLISLGDALVNCRRLEYLFISNNQLEDFGNGFPAASNSLKEIHASNNKIQTLKGFGRGLQCLDEIDLSFNSLSSTAGFATSIRKTLKVLHLNHCKFNNFQDWKSFPRLTHLYISNNNISNLENISNLFPSLEILNLKNNRIASISDLEPLKKLKETLVILKVKGNPLCSDLEYVAQIKKEFPNVTLDDEEYQGTINILKDEEQKLFDDYNLDFRMDLDSLKKQLDTKLEINKNPEFQKQVSDPATEKFLKFLDQKENELSKVSHKNKSLDDMLSKDDAKIMYEECQLAKDNVEKKFEELYNFFDTPYEDLILDGKKLVTRTTTIQPEDIRNISRPVSKISRPSTASSISSATSFDDYFKPNGALDIDLKIDDDDDNLTSISLASQSKKSSKLQKRLQDAKTLSNQINENLSENSSDLNHQKLYKTSGLDRKLSKNSEEIFKNLNIPTMKNEIKKTSSTITTGSRKFRVPKKLLEKANTNTNSSTS